VIQPFQRLEEINLTTGEKILPIEIYGADDVPSSLVETRIKRCSSGTNLGARKHSAKSESVFTSKKRKSVTE
jgi:hypothetical protein